MRVLLCAIGCALAISTATATAQTAPDFSTLRLKVGDTIYVTDTATGVEVSGPLKTFAPAQLSIDGYVFTPVPGLRIDRPGDPIWDGALIGFGVGALLGTTVGAEACLHRSEWHCVAEGGLTYALFGAFIDFVHKGRGTIYRGSSGSLGKSVRLVPEVGSGRKGVALAIGF
jgi:hypothetical protein